jgi:N-acetylmuramoyl-L-alanine amidase
MSEGPTLSGLDTAAKTVWGEARGEGDDGMLAVACVLVNRLRRGRPGHDGSLLEVCVRRKQFSCWNDGDPNLDKIRALTPDDALYRRALIAVLRAIDLAGTPADPTHGATHYHALAVTPYWAPGMRETATIGRHRFYSAVRP